MFVTARLVYNMVQYTAVVLSKSTENTYHRLFTINKNYFKSFNSVYVRTQTLPMVINYPV